MKEIPGFLFGEVGPESGGASLDGERASPEGKSDSRAASAVHKVKFKQWVVPPSCCQTVGGVTPSHEHPSSMPAARSADETVASDFSRSGFCMASSTPLGPRPIVPGGAGEASLCALPTSPVSPSFRPRPVHSPFSAQASPAQGVCPHLPEPIEPKAFLCVRSGDGK